MGGSWFVGAFEALTLKPPALPEDTYYQATEKLWLQLNPEFFVNANDFNASNGQKTHWEPSIVARYRVDKHWLPYAEVAWLDQDENHDDQVRFCLGIRYYFD